MSRKKQPPVDPFEETIDEATAEVASEVVFGEIVRNDDGTFQVSNPVNQKTAELTTAERMRQAVQMRLMGASYSAIAAQLGYADASGAHKAVQAGHKEARQDGATDLRDTILARYESLMLVHWPNALKGDLQAFAACMSINAAIIGLTGISGLPLEEVEQVEGLIIGGSSEDYINGLRKARQQLKSGK